MGSLYAAKVSSPSLLRVAWFILVISTRLEVTNFDWMVVLV